MKSAIKKIITKTARINVGWYLYNKLAKVSEYSLLFYRYADAARRGEVIGAEDFVAARFPDLTVRNGIFKGMKYPGIEAAGSAILPKLIGSYERELNGIFTQILGKHYTDIVDIGCAEGYYAVGLGIKFPKATIYSFDTDRKALRMCKKMADLNGVNILLGGFCNPMKMLSMNLGARALILSDCEGYEKTLFTKSVAKFLAKHEVLIEIHDFIDDTISSAIKTTFENTHDIQIVESVDDAKKTRDYDFKELDGYNERERRFILSEHRPAIMDWFYFTPKIS